MGTVNNQYLVVGNAAAGKASVIFPARQRLVVVEEELHTLGITASSEDYFINHEDEPRIVRQRRRRRRKQIQAPREGTEEKHTRQCVVANGATF